MTVRNRADQTKILSNLLDHTNLSILALDLIDVCKERKHACALRLDLAGEQFWEDQQIVFESVHEYLEINEREHEKKTKVNT